MFKIFLATFLLPILSFAQLVVSPAPVSGVIDLDSTSATIYFSNPSTTPVVMSVSLTPKSGFSMPINRCAGKTLNRNQNCYITISVNDSLLASGINTTTVNQNGSPAFTVQRTKIQGSGSSNFSQATLVMNDFNSYDIVIVNLTPGIKNYNPIISGTDASKYSITLNRCQNVGIGKTCAVTVKLAPQSAGSYSATVTEPQVTGSMTLSSTIAPATSGVLLPATENMTIGQTSVSFGTLFRFGVTGYRQVVVTNSGNVAYTPIIALNGAMVKTALNRCNINLLPGRSCSLYIYLDVPSSEPNGVKSNLSLSVKSSALATAQIIPINVDLQVSGNSFVSSPMQLVTEVYSVSVGSYHSCALDANGIARCWGWGLYGQLGASSYSTSNSIPLYVRMDTALSGKTVAGIAASGWSTCSLTTDNKLFCWGYNGIAGSLGNNSTGSTSNPTEIDMTGVLSGKTIKSASMGYGTGCLIASDDYVYCWGDAYRGGLGNGTTTTNQSSLTPILVGGAIQNIQMKQVAKNGYSSCALSVDDRLFCWGDGSSVPVQITLPNSEKAKFISLGSTLNTNYNCVISQSNKIFCWSVFNYSSISEVNLGATLSSKTFTKIVSGGAQMCAITSDNDAYCFDAGNPSVSPTMMALGLPPYNKKIKSVGIGQFHTCASTTDNEVYCWGQNNFGQLGNGTQTNSSSPVLVNFN